MTRLLDLTRTLILASLALASFGCSGDSTAHSGADSGASSRDAGADSSPADASTDSAPTDSGGTRDTGAPDSGLPDSSAPDAEVPDSSLPDSGAPDAGPAPPDWYDPQPPLTAGPHDEWRFVEVPGAVCANGKPSGFFINFSDRSEDLLIFMLGGGICYDNASCALHLNLVQGGMGSDPLAWWMGLGERTNGVFRRDNPENPWRDASYVVLPHCTVDFHTANKESSYASTGVIQQRGYRNVQLAMNYVVPTFADPHRAVTLAGFSAGGVGSVANYHQIASAFEHHGHRPPFLVNDGGPIQPRPFFSVNSHQAIRNGWRLSETIETWCETCAERGYHEALYWNHRLHPGLRSSQICAYADSVVMGLYTLFDAIGNGPHFVEVIPTPPFTYTSMRQGLKALNSWAEGFDGPGMHRSLFYYGDRHGALSVVPIQSGAGAATPWLAEFLRAQLDRDDHNWHSVIP